MFKQAKPAHDAFTFSLGGMTAIASVIAPPAVASDRFNHIRDGRTNQRRGDRVRSLRPWRIGHRQAAMDSCA